MTRLPKLVPLLVVPLCGALPLAGCGHCDGALRMMRASQAELHRWPPAEDDLPEPVPLRADDGFRLVADGPHATGPELLARSGIGPESWFLVQDATGARVPANITADSGGTMCLRGVGFELHPLSPLAPGGYTLVLLLRAVRWPLVDDDEAHTYEGQPAMVRRFVVPGDARKTGRFGRAPDRGAARTRAVDGGPRDRGAPTPGCGSTCPWPAPCSAGAPRPDAQPLQDDGDLVVRRRGRA